MSSIKLAPPKIDPKINIRQRKNVLYQVTYELLKIFHAPNMREVGEILYAGLIDTQAIEKVTLTYYGKGSSKEFWIVVAYDWNTYEVLISSSRKDIGVDSRISSIDQFLGRKLAFEEIYKLLLLTLNLHSKEVSYAINSQREPALEQIVGKFYPIKDRKVDEGQFKKMIYSSKELEEMQVSIYIKKSKSKPSVLRMLSNKLRGM